jgi:hypothetical protein
MEAMGPEFFIATQQCGQILSKTTKDGDLISGTMIFSSCPPTSMAVTTLALP